MMQDISRNERVVCIEYTIATKTFNPLFSLDSSDVIVTALRFITSMRLVPTAKCVIVHRVIAVSSLPPLTSKVTFNKSKQAIESRDHHMH